LEFVSARQPTPAVRAARGSTRAAPDPGQGAIQVHGGAGVGEHNRGRRRRRGLGVARPTSWARLRGADQCGPGELSGAAALTRAWWRTATSSRPVYRS